MMTHALAPEGEIWSIAAMAEHVRSDTICLACREPVHAVMGQERAWHFRHARCDAMEHHPETFAHAYCKHRIAQYMRLRLPRVGTSAGVYLPNATMAFERSEIERSVGSIRPDLLLFTESCRVAVELCYSNPVSPQKSAEYERLGLPAIEIRIQRPNPLYQANWIGFLAQFRSPRRWVSLGDHEGLGRLLASHALGGNDLVSQLVR